jgi:hypothetical protein
MNEIFPGVSRVLPTKPTPSECISFFVRRAEGNLLFPCFSGGATIDGRLDQIAAMGDLSRQLLGDSHFKAPHCDEVAGRLGAPLDCIEPEAPDVVKSVRDVVTFPWSVTSSNPGWKSSRHQATVPEGSATS